MPEERDAARDAASRAGDHAEIERLMEGLVPALVAKLGTLNVGELEVREGDWHVRLRRPAGAASTYGRRASDRPGSRSHPGHDALGAPAAPRGAGPIAGAAGADGPSGNGSAGPGLAAAGPGRVDGEHDGHADGGSAHAPIATSPAVGVFQPGNRAVGGTRVRAGDRLGVVDMLGIPHDVTAPADGIVIGVLVEGGTAVEYGQELIHIEPAGAEAR